VEAWTSTHPSCPIQTTSNPLTVRIIQKAIIPPPPSHSWQTLPDWFMCLDWPPLATVPITPKLRSFAMRLYNYALPTHACFGPADSMTIYFILVITKKEAMAYSMVLVYKNRLKMASFRHPICQSHMALQNKTVLIPKSLILVLIRFQLPHHYKHRIRQTCQIRALRIPFQFSLAACLG